MSWAEFLTLAPGSDRIPVELFQILKTDAVESAALNIQYALNMQYAGSRQLLNGDYVNKNIDEYFDSHQYFVLMLEFCSFSSDVSIPYNL